MKLLLEAAAERALKALRNDPGRAHLFAKIVDVIRTIRRDPTAASVRREAWRTEGWGQVWAVPVRGTDEEWLIVWTTEQPDTVIVLYIGEDV